MGTLGERDYAPVDKLIARAGVASLREAGRMIRAGRVAVNGSVSTRCSAYARAEEVALDGRPLPAADRARVFLFHKPPGVLDHKDADHRASISLPSHLPRMAVVGGLGFDTEGALLLTNDGRLAKLIEVSKLPSCYRVLVQAQGSAAQAYIEEKAEWPTPSVVPSWGKLTDTLLEPISGAWLTFTPCVPRSEERRVG